MEKNLTHKNSVFCNRNGFALISSLMIMMLLMLVALAMLSLSSSSVSSAKVGKGISEAKANARMALMLAIGELQEQMGPDQRISANGAIVSQTDVLHPHWTGVWDSWKAGTDTNSQHSTIGDSSEMAPTYETNRRDYFRGWLLSLDSGDLDPDNALNVTLPMSLALDGKLSPAIDETAIRLVGEGSLASGATPEKDYVSARLLSVNDPSDPSKIMGRYGWWIGDESQKARLLSDSYQNGTLTTAEKIFRSQAPASMGNTTAPGLESISNEQEIDKLSSLKTLDLIGLDAPHADNAPKVSQLNFHNATIYSNSVLADVREGGLKRDLNTILEQPIDRDNSGDEYMLYAFDDNRWPGDLTHTNSRVPIQDLAAYYQLYDDDPDWSEGRRAGVRYDSGGLSDSIQASTPDYGATTSDRQKFLRQYTAVYSQPVITKMQFLLAVGAEPITGDDRQHVITNAKQRNGSPQPQIRPTDSHKLRMGIMPMVTLWNPTNLPLVMDNEQFLRFGTPPFAIQYRKYRSGTPNDSHDFYYYNLNYAMGGDSVTTGVARRFDPHIVQFRFARGSPIIFEPGEVKVFSIPPGTGGTLTEEGEITEIRSTTIDPVNEWDPYGFFLVPNSVPQGPWSNEAPEAYGLPDSGECMVFDSNDRLTFQIVTENVNARSYQDGRRVSKAGEVYGAGFNLHMFDAAYRPNSWRNWLDFLRHYQMLSRHGNDDDVKSEVVAFNADLMTPGFPGGVAPVEFKNYANAIRCEQIILASEDSRVTGLMEFSLSIGSESGTSSNAGFGGGRRVASRPFLHSNPSVAPFIDRVDPEALYNYGWDWQLGPIINVADSIIRGNPDDPSKGYYGGGYTSDLGTTHVVHRELPVLPPISIASLSHAQLGGYSLAYSAPMGDDPENDTYWWKADRMRDPIGTDYQQLTATGQGGLAPQVSQAIGNSYAHPNVPADKAFTTWMRHFDADDGPVVVPFVDHSYLANKALWDEFFFSSIAPQPSEVLLFGSTSRTAKQVADDFFFNDQPLPNRRINPYMGSLNPAKLDTLFTAAGTYTDGLADKLAANLMVDGAFNVNSTSVDAWKVFLSSLKGKPVAYLDGGITPQEAVTEGTTFSPGILPNAAPIKTADITGPNVPAEQWKAGRELTDEDIQQLSVAIVKQVKLRGPFLSLSEFVNRRLDDSNLPFSLKGALQAALDDESVAINANFREPGRMLDAETASITNFEFPDAAKGPIAYGSAPYVDQADVLQHFSEQLTPRGDTFVIRTYGDSIDASGKIVARAWCEAVIQRIPDYVDSSSGTGDEAYKKQSDLISETNKTFGRQFKIISFRWLNSNEV
jgi:hypothetical protein